MVVYVVDVPAGATVQWLNENGHVIGTGRSITALDAMGLGNVGIQVFPEIVLDGKTIVTCAPMMLGQGEVATIQFENEPPPSTIKQREWSPAEVERYCLGLIVEEMGEAAQQVGKGLRFGIDDDRHRPEGSPRTLLQRELSDVWAAIEFAILHGVVNGPDVLQAKQAKIRKLTNAMSRDNIGRQLAPPLA